MNPVTAAGLVLIVAGLAGVCMSSIWNGRFELNLDTKMFSSLENAILNMLPPVLAAQN